jgi:hypothetical protein
MARAISSLPVPVSPVTRTVESVWRDLGDACEHQIQGGRDAHDLLEHGCLVNFVAERDVLSEELVLQRLVLIQSPLESGLGLLTILDIDARSEPFNDGTVLVTEGVLLMDHPAILPVRPADARFFLKGFPSRDGSAPLFYENLNIFGMNTGSPLPAEQVAGLASMTCFGMPAAAVSR